MYEGMVIMTPRWPFSRRVHPPPHLAPIHELVLAPAALHSVFYAEQSCSSVPNSYIPCHTVRNIACLFLSKKTILPCKSDSGWGSHASFPAIPPSTWRIYLTGR